MDILNSGYLAPVSKEILRGKQYQTPILNTFFKRKVYVKNDVVAVPKENGTYDDILPVINPRGAIPTSNSEWANMQMNYYELKTFGRIDTLTPQDIEDYRLQLQNLENAEYQAKKVEIVNNVMENTLNKVLATREFMASSAILGDVKDKDGNTLYTFNIPASNKLGNKKVSDDTDKLPVVIQTMINTAMKSTKYRGGFGFVIGQNALLKILESPSYNNSQDYMGRGVMERVAGVDGWLFGKYPYIIANDWYYSANGKKSFFNEDTLELLPTELFAEFYGKVFTEEGSFAEIPHIDTFKQRNPDGTAIRTQFKSAPIVTLSNGIVTATLS